ncbi:MAG: hypothetical protein ACHQD9_06860 [Chitinophagales bacterium]
MVTFLTAFFTGFFLATFFVDFFFAAFFAPLRLTALREIFFAVRREDFLDVFFLAFMRNQNFVRVNFERSFEIHKFFPRKIIHHLLPKPSMICEQAGEIGND